MVVKQQIEIVIDADQVEQARVKIRVSRGCQRMEAEEQWVGVARQQKTAAAEFVGDRIDFRCKDVSLANGATQSIDW